MKDGENDVVFHFSKVPAKYQVEIFPAKEPPLIEKPKKNGLWEYSTHVATWVFSFLMLGLVVSGWEMPQILVDAWWKWIIAAIVGVGLNVGFFLWLGLMTVENREMQWKSAAEGWLVVLFVAYVVAHW
jgi:hypothetical protein